MRNPKVLPSSTQWRRFPSLRGYSRPFRSCAQPHRTTTGYNRDVLAVRTTRKRLECAKVTEHVYEWQVVIQAKRAGRSRLTISYMRHEVRTLYTQKEGPIRSGTLIRSHSSTGNLNVSRAICYLSPTSRPDRVMLAAGLMRGSELTSTQSLRYVASSLTDHTLPSHCG